MTNSDEISLCHPFGSGEGARGRRSLGRFHVGDVCMANICGQCLLLPTHLRGIWADMSTGMLRDRSNVHPRNLSLVLPAIDP